MGSIGYARVSTPEQDLALQLDALEEAGCERVFHDVASGADDARPQLAACLDFLRPGDVLVVWKLDRLGRSLRHLVETIAALEQRDVHVRSLTDGVDTSTAAGRMVAGLFSVLAEYERELIRERTIAGLAAARARGTRVGRPPVVDDDRRTAIIGLADDGLSHRAIARTVGVSRSTVGRTLRDAEDAKAAVGEPPT